MPSFQDDVLLDMLNARVHDFDDVICLMSKSTYIYIYLDI